MQPISCTTYRSIIYVQEGKFYMRQAYGEKNNSHPRAYKVRSFEFVTEIEISKGPTVIV
jgi:hypothetical protein